MKSYKWDFSCRDNGGKFQYFQVSANDKTTAIKKGFEKARKNSKGDITSWDCHLRKFQ